MKGNYYLLAVAACASTPCSSFKLPQARCRARLPEFRGAVQWTPQLRLGASAGMTTVGRQAQKRCLSRRTTPLFAVPPVGPKELSAVECFSRLMIAAVMGAAIGFERKKSERPAGIRTMALVSLGAAIFTCISIYGLAGDQSRIAANVASGVGFIGAGVISQTPHPESRKKPNTVNGLTTATAIWVSAALGVSSGCGLHVLTMFAAGIAVVVLRIRRVARVMRQYSRTVSVWLTPLLPWMWARELEASTVPLPAYEESQRVFLGTTAVPQSGAEGWQGTVKSSPGRVTLPPQQQQKTNGTVRQVMTNIQGGADGEI